MSDRKQAIEIIERMEFEDIIDYQKAFETLMYNYLSGKDALDAARFVLDEFEMGL